MSKDLETANGIVQTDQVCEVQIPILEQQVTPFVVDNSPPLLSLENVACLTGSVFRGQHINDLR